MQGEKKSEERKDLYDLSTHGEFSVPVINMSFKEFFHIFVAIFKEHR